MITIGTFDGVHLGHQKIIEQLLLVASTKNLVPVILTFFPHPRMVLQPNFKMELLNTIDEKKQILKKLGVDELVIKPFTRAFSELSARDYIEQILINELNAKHVIIGYDHRFGKGRSANIDDMKAFGLELNFTVQEIPAQDIEAITISSTKVRSALKNGNLELANSFLGYHYFITGKVVKGRGLGREIGFPTANINVDEDYKLIPKQGVYIVSSELNGNTIQGMMNIGTNPTVKGEEQTIEVHFLNFNQDLYSKDIVIKILHRIRDEQVFKSLEELKVQLEKDKLETRAYFKQNR